MHLEVNALYLYSDIILVPGDTMSLTGLIVDGFITGGMMNIILSIPCGMMLTHVSSACISGYSIQVRQNGNYIIGSASGGARLDGTVTISISKDMGCLQLNFIASTAISNAENNNAVAAQFYGGTITFA